MFAQAVRNILSIWNFCSNRILFETSPWIFLVLTFIQITKLFICTVLVTVGCFLLFHVMTFARHFVHVFWLQLNMLKLFKLIFMDFQDKRDYYTTHKIISVIILLIRCWQCKLDDKLNMKTLMLFVWNVIDIFLSDICEGIFTDKNWTKLNN